MHSGEACCLEHALRMSPGYLPVTTSGIRVVCHQRDAGRGVWLNGITRGAWVRHSESLKGEHLGCGVPSWVGVLRPGISACFCKRGAWVGKKGFFIFAPAPCVPASFLRHRRFLSRNAGITLCRLVSLALPSAEQRSLQRSGRGKERDLCRPLVAASS